MVRSHRSAAGLLLWQLGTQVLQALFLRQSLLSEVRAEIIALAFWRNWTLQRATSERCRLPKRFASSTKTLAGYFAQLKKGWGSRGANTGSCGVANSEAVIRIFTRTQS